MTKRPGVIWRSFDYNTKQMEKTDLNFNGSPGQNLSAVSVAKKDWGYHHSLFVDGWKGREFYATHKANLEKIGSNNVFFASSVNWCTA